VLEVEHDVEGARLEEAAAEEAAVVDDAHRAARRGDGAELGVVEVAPVSADAGEAGVAHDQGSRGVVHGNRVPEATPADVGQVDQDPPRLQGGDEVLPAGRQPGIGAEPER
jgi:hypothetical protein